MQPHQQEFLEYALARGVLRFGEFKLKSGRLSPYFFNAGLFDSGDALARLGRWYARTAVDSGIAFDMVFGPAYKGIPLATVTAAALAEHHGRDLRYCFNRKEAKDHGEGGALIGARLEGRVLIVDDVITAGTAIREAVGIIRSHGATPVGVVRGRRALSGGRGASRVRPRGREHRPAPRPHRLARAPCARPQGARRGPRLSRRVRQRRALSSGRVQGPVLDSSRNSSRSVPHGAAP